MRRRKKDGKIDLIAGRKREKLPSQKDDECYESNRFNDDDDDNERSTMTRTTMMMTRITSFFLSLDNHDDDLDPDELFGIILHFSNTRLPQNEKNLITMLK